MKEPLVEYAQMISPSPLEALLMVPLRGIEGERAPAKFPWLSLKGVLLLLHLLRPLPGGFKRLLRHFHHHITGSGTGRGLLRQGINVQSIRSLLL